MAAGGNQSSATAAAETDAYQRSNIILHDNNFQRREGTSAQLLLLSLGNLKPQTIFHFFLFFASLLLISSKA